jgi:hypothetical protein
MDPCPVPLVMGQVLSLILKMKRALRIFLRVAAVVLILLIAGVAFLYLTLRPDEHGRIIPWGERVDMAVLPAFHESLGSAQRIVILEGLPRRRGERELLESEIRSNETVKIRGFHFYARELELSSDEARAFVGLLTTRDGMVDWAGTKMCGGFHPDFAARWTDPNGTTFEALICLGCHEIKLSGGGHRLYADISDALYDPLREFLGNFAERQPEAIPQEDEGRQATASPSAAN